MTSTVQVLQQRSTERGESRLQCAGSQTALISNSIHFPGHQEEIKPIQGSRNSDTMGIYWLEDDCQALSSSWARSSQIAVDQTSHDCPSLSTHPYISAGLQATFLHSPLLSLAEEPKEVIISISYFCISSAKLAASEEGPSLTGLNLGSDTK